MRDAPLSVSVVIPCLNEAAALPEALASVRAQAGPVEVLVVDGGSKDATPRIAEAEGSRVIAAARGRALQMNAGAAAATADVLLFLHADTRLPADGLGAIREALGGGAVAGCFRLRFDRSSPWLRLWTLPIWMRWHRLAFGDRALFVRRDAFETLGGFAEVPLFEDLDFVRRVRHVGQFAFLDAAVTTSARRFNAHGRFRQQGRNALLWAAWQAGVSPERLARFYRYGADSSA